MITDTQIKLDGLKALVSALGEVEAEKFITLMMREPFDYTKWQQRLWTDRNVEDISRAAMQHRKNSRSRLKRLR